MSSLSNRWSYGFAFGAVSSSVLLLFSESYLPFPVPPWARGTPPQHHITAALWSLPAFNGLSFTLTLAILYLVGALEIGVVYLPFFACLSTPFRTVGAVLGILYSLPW